MIFVPDLDQFLLRPIISDQNLNVGETADRVKKKKRREEERERQRERETENAKFD